MNNHLSQLHLILILLSLVFLGSGCTLSLDPVPQLPTYVTGKEKCRGNALILLRDHANHPELTELIRNKLLESGCRLYEEKEQNTRYLTQPELILEIQELSLRYSRVEDNVSLLDTRLLVLLRKPGNLENTVLYCGSYKGYQVWARHKVGLYSPFLDTAGYLGAKNGKFLSISKLMKEHRSQWKDEVLVRLHYDYKGTISTLTERLFSLEPFRKQLLITPDMTLQRKIHLASQGKADAMLYLINYYMDNKNNVKDPREALYWGLRAAKQGVDSHLKLMDSLLAELPVQDNDSRQMSLHLARKGYPEGMYHLAMSYTRPDQMKKRIELLKQAAGKDHLKSIYQYGKDLMVMGPNRDPHTGIRMLKKAAEKGHKQAALELYTIYKSGNGVPANITIANFWYDKYAGNQ